MKIVIIYDPVLENYQNDESSIINSYHNLVTSSIASALNQSGHQVETFGASTELERHLHGLKPDLVFNTSIKSMDGSKYAYAPDLLEKLHIPFTGPSAKACTNAYDKLKTIEILKEAGIHTPPAITFSEGNDLRIPVRMNFPLFVKPQRGGCSRGISNLSLIEAPEEFIERIIAVLDEIKQPVIVEEFLPGREFTVGILGNQPPKVLPIIEFIYTNKELPFRSYSRKMVNYEIEDTVCFPQLKEADRVVIENLAVSAFKALECRDYARIDIRMDALGNPFILEVNAIPNLEPEKSSFALMSNHAEIPFNKLVEEITKYAFKRFKLVNS
ncbi:MAG: ATP-grasp domain-containing protein [Pelolinea sp.]|nr:ATP-grasp domain-containing protein [Pelolinea sp.]